MRQTWTLTSMRREMRWPVRRAAPTVDRLVDLILTMTFTQQRGRELRIRPLVMAMALLLLVRRLNEDEGGEWQLSESNNSGFSIRRISGGPACARACSREGHSKFSCSVIMREMRAVRDRGENDS